MPSDNDMKELMAEFLDRHRNDPVFHAKEGMVINVLDSLFGTRDDHGHHKAAFVIIALMERAEERHIQEGSAGHPAQLIQLAGMLSVWENARTVRPAVVVHFARMVHRLLKGSGEK